MGLFCLCGITKTALLQVSWLHLQFCDLRDLSRALRVRYLMELVFHIRIFPTGRQFGLISEHLLRQITFGTGNTALVGPYLFTSTLGWTSRHRRRVTVRCDEWIFFGMVWTMSLSEGLEKYLFWCLRDAANNFPEVKYFE